MMIQCQNCGCQVRVTKNRSNGLVSAVVMLLVVAAGGAIVYRTLFNTAGKDAQTLHSHIGQIGE